MRTNGLRTNLEFGSLCVLRAEPFAVCAPIRTPGWAEGARMEGFEAGGF